MQRQALQNDRKNALIFLKLQHLKINPEKTGFIILGSSNP